MYRIDKTEYGTRVTFGGRLTADEVRRFSVEIVRIREERKGPRSVVMDLRSLLPPEPDVIELLNGTFQGSKETGLKRAAVIVNSPVVKGQAVQIAFVAQLADDTRYIDASKNPDWEARSVDWALNGIEPDMVERFPKMNVPGA